jgi:hypothetical protein
MLREKKTSHELPAEFQKYFWDVAFDELSTIKHSRFIAERLLNFGDMKAIRWLLSFSGKHFIRSVIDNSRNINSKTRNYWKIILA